DTPPRIVRLIQSYLVADDPAAKQAATTQLLAEGKRGYLTLRKLAAAEREADVRQTLFEQIARVGGREAGLRLAEGDVQGAEGILEACLIDSVDATFRNYAACFLLVGKADDKARELRARVAKGADKQAAEL